VSDSHEEPNVDQEQHPELFAPELSPVVQAPYWGLSSAYDWQKAIWDAIWRPGALIAARTCNESGKTSWVVPVLAMSWCAAMPGSQVVITSASERQLEKQLEPSLRNMAMKETSNGWSYRKGTITAPSVDGLPPSMITWFSTKSGELFEGFHNKDYEDQYGRLRRGPLLVIVDEGKTVKPEIYTAVERCNPTCQLNISTTGEDSGDFYDSCMNANGLWTTSHVWNGVALDFVIPWTMCPHLMTGMNYKRKKAMLDKDGEDNPVVASILLAEFFRGGTHMVFDSSDLNAIIECMSGSIPHISAGRNAFCDFSGGGDELVFGVRDGNMVHPLVAWTRSGNTPPSEEAEKYIRLFRQFDLKPEQIAGDNGGLGALIISEMERRGWPIRRINPNIPAIQKSQFVDRYTEDHFKLKELVQTQSIILPRDETLLKQMRLRRYVMKNTEDNKLRIEPKETARKDRREPSPDRLDVIIGLVQSMHHMPDMQKAVAGKLRCPMPKEYNKQIEDSIAQGEIGESVWQDW
jgi:hypothetical protein